VLGRPVKATPSQQTEIINLRKNGTSISLLSRAYGASHLERQFMRVVWVYRYTYVTGRSLSLWAITQRATPTSTTHCKFLSRFAVPLFQKPQQQALNENKIWKSKTERKPWGF
jgi:hypothetical protein